MQRTVALTESEVALLLTSLWTASERYADFARSIPGEGNLLRKQFKKQHDEALALRAKLDNVDAIQIVESPEHESDIEQAKRRGRGKE